MIDCSESMFGVNVRIECSNTNTVSAPFSIFWHYRPLSSLHTESNAIIRFSAIFYIQYRNFMSSGLGASE